MRKFFTWIRWTHKTTISWLSLSPQNVPKLIKTKQPVHISVWGGVPNDGVVMSSFIFPYDHRLNTEAFIKWLEEIELPWIERVTTGRPYIWKQASVPCQTSRRTESCLWENLCDYITPNIWPPHSPDCNPLDYYVWGAVDWGQQNTA